MRDIAAALEGGYNAAATEYHGECAQLNEVNV